MQVKILEDAVKKYENLPGVQRALAVENVHISHTALHNAHKGKTRTLRFDVLAKLVELVYNGDWNKAGKGIKEDAKK